MGGAEGRLWGRRALHRRRPSRSGPGAGSGFGPPSRLRGEGNLRGTGASPLRTHRSPDPDPAMGGKACKRTRPVAVRLGQVAPPKASGAWEERRARDRGVSRAPLVAPPVARATGGRAAAIAMARAPSGTPELLSTQGRCIWRGAGTSAEAATARRTTPRAGDTGADHPTAIRQRPGCWHRLTATGIRARFGRRASSQRDDGAEDPATEGVTKPPSRTRTRTGAAIVVGATA